MMSSCGGMAVTAAILVVSAASPNFGHLGEWTSLAMFLLFVFFGTYGVMGIPWTLAVELLPTKLRSTGSSVIVSFGYLIMFFSAKIFPFVLDSCSTCLVFGFLALEATFFAIFVYFCVPETLNKSFVEIEQYFSGHRVADKKFLGTI